MRSPIFPINPKFETATIHTLAQDSGLAWKTVRDVVEGQGTITSLDKLRAALDLKWSWTLETDGTSPGAALAARRKAKGISQRALAEKLQLSPQTVVTLERQFIGRIDTLRRYLRALRINGVLTTKSNRLVPPRNEAHADIVYTPRELARQIIAVYGSELQGRVLDPARGDGAFYDALPDHVEKLWCEAGDNCDFYDWTAAVDWIVTNPPWSDFRDFLQHSLTVADNIVFLAPLNHFTTKRRVSMIREAGFGVRRILIVPTPTDWPSSGFQLAAVWLSRGWRGPAEFAVLADEEGKVRR